MKNHRDKFLCGRECRRVSEVRLFGPTTVHEWPLSRSFVDTLTIRYREYHTEHVTPMMLQQGSLTNWSYDLTQTENLSLTT